MQAFKIDLMALLVIAVVLGIGLTMALSHYAVADPSANAPEMGTVNQMHSSADSGKAQFINASQAPDKATKLESRI